MTSARGGREPSVQGLPEAPRVLPTQQVSAAADLPGHGSVPVPPAPDRVL